MCFFAPGTSMILVILSSAPFHTMSIRTKLFNHCIHMCSCTNLINRITIGVNQISGHLMRCSPVTCLSGTSSKCSFTCITICRIFITRRRHRHSHQQDSQAYKRQKHFNYSLAGCRLSACDSFGKLLSNMLSQLYRFWTSTYFVDKS